MSVVPRSPIVMQALECANDIMIEKYFNSNFEPYKYAEVHLNCGHTQRYIE